jgi:hypothetical protein
MGAASRRLTSGGKAGAGTTRTFRAKPVEVKPTDPVTLVSVFRLFLFIADIAS